MSLNAHNIKDLQTAKAIMTQLETAGASSLAQGRQKIDLFIDANYPTAKRVRRKQRAARPISSKNLDIICPACGNRTGRKLRYSADIKTVSCYAPDRKGHKLVGCGYSELVNDFAAWLAGKDK